MGSGGGVGGRLSISTKKRSFAGKIRIAMSKELKHTPQTGKKLSRNQQMFNGLTLRIESLKEELASEQDKLERLGEMYAREVAPMHVRIAETRYAVAKALARASERIGFQRRVQEDITRTIVELCSEAFAVLEPDGEMEDFYNRWARQSYREEQNEQLYRAKEMFADMMRDRYDMDIDVEDIEDSTEGFAQFRQRIRQQQEQERKDFWKQSAAQSQKQKAKEAAAKAEEELRRKGIRSVYIALAKVLHPDGENDATLKAEKEELMKRVTAAYEEQDLQTLLKLELEWVHKTTENLDRQTDDKLKVYLAVLRQQVSELEAQKLELVHAPRFAQVSPYANMPQNIATSRILRDKKDLKQYNNDLNGVISALRTPGAKSYLLDFVEYYMERIEKKEQDDQYWNL